MFKHVMRLAALALALVTVGTAVQHDILIPDCGACTGTGTN